MPNFDKFDICEAYLALEQDWNKGGWLQERPSNKRRMQSTDVQLHRMKFRPGAGWNGYRSLSDNGREIYHLLEVRYGFDKLQMAQHPVEILTSDDADRIFDLEDFFQGKHIDTYVRLTDGTYYTLSVSASDAEEARQLFHEHQTTAQ